MPTIEQLQEQRLAILSRKKDLELKLADMRISDRERKRLTIEYNQLNLTSGELRRAIAALNSEMRDFKVITDGVEICRKAKLAFKDLMEYTVFLEGEVANLKRLLEEKQDTHEF